MKNVIPFTKEIIFKSNIAEISSISLENDFKVEEETINGNFIVSGDYKAHELSVNKDNFKYNLPFTIEIDSDINKDSISLEVEDFSYDFHDDVLKVNIEFSVTGERIKEEKVNEKDDDLFEDARSYFEEIERKAQLDDLENNNDEEILENIENYEEKQERDEISDMIDTLSEVKETKVEENMEEAKEMILNSTSKDDDYVTYHVHIVKETETIESICKLYEVSSSLVNEYNDISNVSVGDKLIIPSYVDE